MICGSSSFVEFSCVESKHDFKEQIKQLEKELYFYKHKTREMRKSMALSTTNLTQDDGRKSKTDNHQQAPFILKAGNRSNSAHQS